MSRAKKRVDELDIRAGLAEWREFMATVLEVLGEVSPEVRDKVIDRLRREAKRTRDEKRDTDAN